MQFLGKELVGATFTAQDARCLYKGALQNRRRTLLLLSPFLIKAKILFRFLSVSENNTNVGLS